MKTRSLSISRRQFFENSRQVLLFLIACACFGAVLGQMPSVSSLFRNSVAAARGNVPSPQGKRKKGIASKSKTARPTSARSAAAIKLAAAAATNDNCAAATVIASCPFTNTVDTTATTNEPGEPESECTSQSNSVWYSYTAGSSSAMVTVDTCGSDYDTAIMVWRVTGAACDFPSLVPIACDDDGAACGGLTSQVAFVAEPGQTYKIQVGGFAGESWPDGETGSLTVNIACQVLLCPGVVVNGALGSGSGDRPFVSGQQSPNRLRFDESPSACAAPKTCPGVSGDTGTFTYDAYTFTNNSQQAQCVTLHVEGSLDCESTAQAVVYLGSYDPANVCLNYLADAGVGGDSTFSFIVPAGSNFVVVMVAGSKGGETDGCRYRFTLTGNICDLCPTLRGTLPNGAQGVPYNQAVAVNHEEKPATYALSVNILPPGLSLNGETGVISGIPSAPGNYTFGIKATGMGGCQKIGPFNLLITATCPTISISPTSLPAGLHGALYSQSLSATGGVGPHVFSVSGGSLPSGLTLNPASGLISGTPTATGTFVFTARAMSQGGCFGYRTYVLTINCTTVTINTNLPNPVKGVAYSQALAASPQGTFTFSLVTGSLPPGFTMNSAGVISGVTNQTGAYSFTVRARTASGCQGTRTYTLTVANP